MKAVLTFIAVTIATLVVVVICGAPLVGVVRAAVTNVTRVIEEK